MAIDRAPWNALVDDDGSNLVGTVWNKDKIKTVILDPTDAAIAALWADVPFNAANYVAGAGAWTMTAANQEVYSWSAITPHTALVMFRLTGAMTLSLATTFLFVNLPAAIPTPARLASMPFTYYLAAGSVTGTGMAEVRTNKQIALLRDIAGTPWPATTGAMFMYGTAIFSY